MLVKSTGHILEQGAANQRGGVDVRVLRSPSEGGAGQTEAIGGGHDDLVALELHANAGQYRAVFFAGDGNARLVHGLNESRGIDLAEHGRYHRQIRVLGVGCKVNFDLPDVMVSVEPSVPRYVFSERSDLVISASSLP